MKEKRLNNSSLQRESEVDARGTIGSVTDGVTGNLKLMRMGIPRSSSMIFVTARVFQLATN